MPPLFRLPLRVRAVRGPRSRLRPGLLALASLVLAALGGGARAGELPRYRISLLTISPGSELEERLGHSALAVEDRATGKEVAYNFGTFGATDNLVYKFLHKQLSFWVAAMNPGEVAVRYSRREIHVAELALTDEQAGRLATTLEQRVRPESRGFDYDLFTANCVTPIRDVLDHALGGALRRQTDTPSGHTYRQDIMQGLRPVPLLGAFSALVYGPYTDVPRSRWEMLFMPDALHDAVAALRNDALPGAPPLVRAERLWRGELFEDPLPLPDPRLLLVPLFALLALGLGARGDRGRRLLGGLAVLLGLGGGVLGASIYYLGFSAHPCVQENANRYLLSPLDLAALPLLLLLFAERLRPAGQRWLLYILGGTTLLGAGHAVLGHVVGLCPQRHAPVILWVLGGRLLLVTAVWLALRPRPSVAPA